MALIFVVTKYIGGRKRKCFGLLLCLFFLGSLLFLHLIRKFFHLPCCLIYEVTLACHSTKILISSLHVDLFLFRLSEAFSLWFAFLQYCVREDLFGCCHSLISSSPLNNWSSLIFNQQCLVCWIGSIFVLAQGLLYLIWNLNCSLHSLCSQKVFIWDINSFCSFLELCI